MIGLTERYKFAWLPIPKYVVEDWEVTHSGWYWLQPVKQVLNLNGTWMAFEDDNK